MIQFSRRHAPLVVAALAAASLLAVGCGISAPSANVIDRFSSTVELNGFAYQEFAVGKEGGEVTITVTSISPDSGATLGLLYGQFAASSTTNCQAIQQALATQGRAAITNRIAKGGYCLVLYDPGGGLLTRAETTLSKSLIRSAAPMYQIALIVHSWLRWGVILAGILALRSLLTAKDGDRWGLLFMMALDVQMLVGLTLYLALSPNMAAILANFGTSMGDPVARFWAVEHGGSMMLAVVFVHVGRVLARRAPTPPEARLRQLICFGIAFVLILAATPWPGMANGRPLFRV